MHTLLCLPKKFECEGERSTQARHAFELLFSRVQRLFCFRNVWNLTRPLPRQSLGSCSLVRRIVCERLRCTDVMVKIHINSNLGNWREFGGYFRRLALAA